MQNFCESDQLEHSLHSQETTDATRETSDHLSSETDDFANGPSTNTTDYIGLKGRLSLDLHYRNQKLHPDEAGLRQGRETLPEKTCCQLKAAIEQVTDLFDKIEMVENLYPTRHSLGQQHPKYTSNEFTRNFETMCLWLNVTRELYHKLHLIAKFVGVNVAETGVWQDWQDVGLGRLGKVLIKKYMYINKLALCLVANHQSYYSVAKFISLSQKLFKTKRRPFKKTLMKTVH